VPRDIRKPYVPEQDSPEEDDVLDALEFEEELEEETDEVVTDLFNEAQNLDYGRGQLNRKLKNYTSRDPILSGGDVDAGWEYADVGEETVGGQNPTPDQSDVDDNGAAVGLTYRDNEPIDSDEKLARRDREPWELNPASEGRQYSARVKQEFQEPLDVSSENRSKAKVASNKQTRNARPGTRVRGTATTGRKQQNPRSPQRSAKANAKGKPAHQTQTSRRTGGRGKTARTARRNAKRT
jgi:hypothetical protein